jgi:hypothetical protein
MGAARALKREILVIGILDSGELPFHSLKAELMSRYGAAGAESPVEEFAWTDYYAAEMGGRLSRRFLAFRDPVDPGRLAAIKLETNALELEFSRAAGGRAFNLDPGLLSLGRFILATTKDRSHRIPLHSGIFAELTLTYRGGSFQALPWTYPDYASDGIRALLASWRAEFFEALKAG